MVPNVEDQLGQGEDPDVLSSVVRSNSQSPADEEKSVLVSLEPVSLVSGSRQGSPVQVPSPLGPTSEEAFPSPEDAGKSMETSSNDGALDPDDYQPSENEDTFGPPNAPEIVESLHSTFSSLTDCSDVTSRPSNASSKATTPAEPDASQHQADDGTSQTPVKESSPEPSLPHKSPSYHHSFERLSYTIRPKSSIPTNISTAQYARECIEAAESCRLNPFALHPDEYHLLRHHITHAQVTTYLNIRNNILRIWIQRPWVGVNREEAVGCADARWFDAASVCYDWLLRRGYINFGCAQLQKLPPSDPFPGSPQKRKTVAIIGAGISGLACARQLESLFQQYAHEYHESGQEVPKVVLVEGRSRVGGRVYSRELRSRPIGDQSQFPARRHTAEMGGMIITGFDKGNPMNVLVRGQLGLPCHALTADTTIYDSNGKPVDPVRDQLVEKLFNDCLDRVSEFKFKPQPSKLIEGNRLLMVEGRDSSSDGSKTIMQAEEATAALPHAPPVSQQNVPEQVNMVPVSSDRLTGRVHNEPGNPGSLRAADKAKLMGWTLRSGAADKHDVDLRGPAANEGATLGSVLDHAISQYKHLVDLSAQDLRLINWHVANLEYSNATNIRNLSLELWDMDAGNEWEGRHTMIIGGYQSVARGLLLSPTKLDLTTRFAAKRISYHADDFEGPAMIEAEDGAVIEADCVVCTVPLGVLKHGNIEFDPPLPPWKTDVVQRLGFGILNKVVLVYEKVFWESERHIFGVLRDASQRHSTTQRDYSANRGRFFQWINVTNMAGLPCLIALMAGDAGFDTETEKSSNENLVAEATKILKGVFGKEVPHPVECIVTRWGADRFARGSYSSAAPGILPDDYDTMARPIGNLFFAGEHTIGTHPATVHGAYLSGLHAATEVLEAMIGPIEVPTPLILPRDSLLLHKRKQAAEDPRQARLEAYEAEIFGYIRSQIGERPARPARLAANAYMLYSKAHFEDAKRRCEERRKAGRSRVMPNEVRVMTSKMWKDSTAEQRQPFEDQATELKAAYAETMLEFNDASQKWDREAACLRAVYERDHPSVPGPDEMADDDGPPQKHRRAKIVNYAIGKRKKDAARPRPVSGTL